MEDETIGDLERHYGYDQSVFQERYQGKPPQEIIKRLVKDISDFKCGYGLQARVWGELRSNKLTIDELVEILRSQATQTIKKDVAKVLDQPEYFERLKELNDSQLALVANYIESGENQRLLNELYKRNNVDRDILLYVIDTAANNSNHNPEMKRKFILKYADSLVGYALKWPILVPDEAKKLAEVVRSFLFENEELRNKFTQDYSKNLRDLAYKYLNKE